MLLAGCAGNDSGTSAADQATATTNRSTTSGSAPGSPTTSSTAAAAGAAGAGVEAGVRALQTAARAVPQGRAFDLDLDTTDAGTVVWEVDFRQPDRSTATVTIHARTGKVIQQSGD